LTQTPYSNFTRIIESTVNPAITIIILYRLEKEKMVIRKNPIAATREPRRKGFTCSKLSGMEEIYCKRNGSDNERTNPRKTASMETREMGFSFLIKNVFMLISFPILIYRNEKAI
jgi:hypothetical protein